MATAGPIRSNLIPVYELVLAEVDLCMAICGFRDIASLKEAGCDLATGLLH
jgi:isopentenyl diphosphate isomerase/L-lactate dehydrogenase-like FMN-dependent dehydrogenase